MKYLLSLFTFTAAAVAAPAELVNRAACASAVTLTPSTNPFASRTLHANSAYASEVSAAIASITDATLKTKATAAGKVGTFLWM